MTEPTELKSINGRKWYADGTFFPITGLDHCAQIYIISIKNDHGNYKKTTAPVAFILLPKRTKKIYEEMFKNLQTIAEIEIKPQSFSCDFESAVINTVKKLFPETVIQLCRFHFYQSVKRKLVNLFGKKFYEHKELKEVWTTIKGCSYFGWTRYPEMLENLKEHLRTKNMSFTTALHEEKYRLQFLPYMFQFYLTFEHSYGLLNQDHYTALSNGDPDATNNTSESINRVLKTFSTTGKKNVQTVFRSVYNFKMDHNLRRDAREKCPRKRPDDLIRKYERIKEVLEAYDNLPAEIRTLSLLTYLDCLGNL